MFGHGSANACQVFARAGGDARGGAARRLPLALGARAAAAFFIMPMIVLCGFAFPIRNMPDVLQWASWADPLRFYLVVIRDLFLKGDGPFGHPLEHAMMALLGISALALAVHRVR